MVSQPNQHDVVVVNSFADEELMVQNLVPYSHLERRSAYDTQVYVSCCLSSDSVVGA